MTLMNTSGQPELALVTGAGQGIGAATARMLIEQGMRVIAVDKQPELLTALSDDFGDAVIPCHFDLADMPGIAGMVGDLVDQHGPVTVLVNNAGVWPGGPITEMSDEIWRLNFAINVDAPFALIRCLAPVMAAAGGGRVVNVASRNAVRSSTNNAGYDASKAAVMALTRTAAGELAKDRIRVNSGCPGVVSTPGDASIEEPLFKAAYTRQIPLDRYARPDEIASVIVFLLSENSSYIIGQTIIVDGGQIACQDNRRLMEIPGLKP